ncbi:CinA family protein [Haloplanus rubicundus]|uniref:CinA family protein n=1 Tax=Haloplanus rubicundus TaxID=1547898 RepID=A0A345DYK1_9EURY|nr:CinA family protein [Haloplanus rubicundus]AXG05023.1 CinA family protein [Haloplanus rubicundus]AXG11494.1 CinA family protein [Haloplanus rubicundus]
MSDTHADPSAPTDDAVERRLGRRLRDRGETLAVAESLTGGLVGSLLTDVPGSSGYVDRSVVAYSNDAKLDALGVTRESLDAHGAVSAPVAREMARSVRDDAGTTWGVSTTGIAGPAGGTEEKPVGLVFVGVAYAAPWGTGDSFARAERRVLDGDRWTVKAESARWALRAVEDALD